MTFAAVPEYLWNLRTCSPTRHGCGCGCEEAEDAIVVVLSELASREFGSLEPTLIQHVAAQFVESSGWFRTPEWLEWNALSLFATELGTAPPPEPLDRTLETLFGEHAELVRRLLEGESIEQLASERQVAPSHIKARLRRALHRLDGA